MNSFADVFAPCKHMIILPDMCYCTVLAAWTLSKQFPDWKQCILAQSRRALADRTSCFLRIIQLNGLSIPSATVRSQLQPTQSIQIETEK